MLSCPNIAAGVRIDKAAKAAGHTYRMMTSFMKNFDDLLLTLAGQCQTVVARGRRSDLSNPTPHFANLGFLLRPRLADSRTPTNLKNSIQGPQNQISQLL